MYNKNINYATIVAYCSLFIKGEECNMTLKKRNKIWVFIFSLLGILLVFYLFSAFIFMGMKG